MLIFVYGEEDFLVKRRLKDIKESFIFKNKRAPVFDFDLGEEYESDWGKILSSGGGLFSENKLVLLRNINQCPIQTQKKIKHLLEKRVIAKDSNFWVVGSCINSRSRKGVAKRDKNKKNRKKEEKKATKEKNVLKEFFQKKAQKKEKFSHLSPKEIENFIKKSIQEKSSGQMAIEKEAVLLLASMFGGNIWFLEQSLEKLVCYKESGSIRKSEVEKLITGVDEFQIFDLLDAIGKRNKKEAILVLQSFLEQKVSEFYIFSMIFYQLRNLIKVKQLTSLGVWNEKDISVKLGIHPFVAKKLLGQSRFFSKAELRKIFDLAVRIDEEVKTGKYEIKEGLDLFIFSL